MFVFISISNHWLIDDNKNECRISNREEDTSNYIGRVIHVIMVIEHYNLFY